MLVGQQPCALLSVLVTQTAPVRHESGLTVLKQKRSVLSNVFFLCSSLDLERVDEV